MPRRIILLAIFALLSLIAPTHAADSPDWTAWLHYGRHMTLIDSDGHTLRDLDLPLPDNTQFAIPRLSELTISPDGTHLAYLVQNSTDEKYEIVVYDTLSNQIVMTTKLPDNFISWWTFHQMAFDETASTLTYGFSIPWETDPDNDDWQINILDLKTDKNIAHLDCNIQLMIAIYRCYEGQWQVYIQRVEGLEIHFTLEWNTVTNMRTGYVWDRATDIIREDIAYPEIETDTFLPTNEVIMRLEDDRLPPIKIPEKYLDPFTYILEPDYNSIQIYDPTSSERYPLYSSWGLPRFVQNGERIFIFSGDTDQLIERDGTLVATWALPNLNNLWGTPNGFIYTAGLLMTSQEVRVDFPAVYEVDTRDNQLDVGRLLWQISMKEFHSYFDSSEQPYFDIAWVHSDAPVGPFKPWAQLADPVYAPTPQPSIATITPTTIPMPSPLFHVGQTVRVQTIDGEILNLRAAPTRKSDILVYIEDDTQLELLEGPVEAEGFHWWRVHTPDGLEGWVVENDGELQTILPE